MRHSPTHLLGWEAGIGGVMAKIIIFALIFITLYAFAVSVPEPKRSYHGLVSITEYKPDNSGAFDATYSHLWPDAE